MLIRTRGIVFRRIEHTSSSIIAHIHTQEKGTLPFVIRGLRGKSKRKVLLSPLSMVEISFNYRENRDLQTINDITADPEHPMAISHPEKISIAFFLAEVLQKSLQDQSKDEDLFEFLEKSLEYFRDSVDFKDFHVKFMLRLSRFLGFYPEPSLDSSRSYFDLLEGSFVSVDRQSGHTLSADDSRIFRKLLDSPDYGSPSDWKRKERKRLIELMIEYFAIHLEGFGHFTTLEILKSLYDEA